MMNTSTTTEEISSFTRWLVVLTASLLFFYNFIVMNILNMISISIMSHFGIESTSFGTLAAAYFWGNFIFLLPAGLILDRCSTRKLILFAMALCIVSMIGFPLSKTFFWAATSRFLGGVAGAFAFLGCIRLASRWFPPKKMAFATGWIVTMAFLGGMVAQTPMESLSSYLNSWQHAMLTFGVIGVALLIFMFFIVRDLPTTKTIGKDSIAHKAHSISVAKTIKLVASNPYNWMCGLYTTLMNLPIFILCGAWGGLYLEQAHHLNKTEASYATTMLFVGAIIGSPLIGWISDHIERRVLPMIFGALISLALTLAVIYMPSLTIASLIILFFLIGLVTCTQVLSYPLVAELNSPLITGSAISIISLLIMSSGFIAVPLYGKLLSAHWNHLVIHHIAVYSTKDFQLAMMIMPVAFVVSFVLSLFIKETKCQSLHDGT